MGKAKDKTNPLFQEKGKTFWHYLSRLGYYVPYCIRYFFSNPFKEKKEDLNILDHVGALLGVGPTKANIATCEQLIRLHRVVENTKARRRLERWSLRVIVCYLLIVFGVVVFSYIPVPSSMQNTNTELTTKSPLTTQVAPAKGATAAVKAVLDAPKEEKGFLRIPEAVMITILSTTTINIIGLGLIVLRGHFLFNDQIKGEEYSKGDNNRESGKEGNTQEPAKEGAGQVPGKEDPTQEPAGEG